GAEHGSRVGGNGFLLQFYSLNWCIRAGLGYPRSARRSLRQTRSRPPPSEPLWPFVFTHFHGRQMIPFDYEMLYLPACGLSASVPMVDKSAASPSSLEAGRAKVCPGQMRSGSRIWSLLA